MHIAATADESKEKAHDISTALLTLDPKECNA